MKFDKLFCYLITKYGKCAVERAAVLDGSETMDFRLVLMMFNQESALISRKKGQLMMEIENAEIL